MIHPTLGHGVSEKVLSCGDHAVPEIVALQASYIGGANPTDEVRVLAVGLLNPSPPGVASDIEDRRQGVAGADGHHLPPDGLRHLGDERLIPRGGESDGLWELCGVACAIPGCGLLVDHDGDAEAGPLYRHPLDLVHQLRACGRTETSRRTDAGHMADAVLQLSSHEVSIEAVALDELGQPDAADLGELLVERHAAE